MKTVIVKMNLVVIILLSITINNHAQTWSWSEDYLSYAREGISAAVLDDSIFYSGGRSEGGYLNIIDIFDLGSNLWSTPQLETPARMGARLVAAGGKVFIAGGTKLETDEYFKEIDVYDKENDEWTVELLTEGRIFIETLAYENLVFFAGGFRFLSNEQYFYDIIEIYNTETEEWSEEHLSIPKSGFGIAATNGKVFFAGGHTGPNEVTNVVDIYDINSGEWSFEYLEEARAAIAGVAYGNKVYFAGGALPDGISSDKVEIYNVEYEIWEDIQTLSEPRIVFALNLYDALVFTGHVEYIILETITWGMPNGVVNVYYPETGEWDFTVPEIESPRMWGAYAAYDNKAYYTGGWNLDGLSDVISILDYDPPGTKIFENDFVECSAFVYPNPFSATINIEYNMQNSGPVYITIFSSTGICLGVIENQIKQAGNHTVIFESSDMKPGVYYCKIEIDNGSSIEKIVKVL